MNIFLTLDYELFSSNNPGTPQRCMVEPMNALAEVADKYGVKFTIFVDAAYLYKLEKEKAKSSQLRNDFEMIKNNIHELVSYGHDIQLHFHPQWIYTVWDENKAKWDVDTVHFKLSDMEPETAKDSFALAKTLLDSIVGYSTNCFRACGYCLDTYSDYINLFLDNGIIKDSSVARYCHADTTAHVYDYSVIPEEHIYSFNKNVKEKDEQGHFKEISISSFELQALYLKIKQRLNNPGYIYRDGKALRTMSKQKDSMNWGLFKKKRVLASIDGANSDLLFDYLKIAKRTKQEVLVLGGHPKNATENSIKNLDKFLAATVANHIFLTSRDV